MEEEKSLIELIWTWVKGAGDVNLAEKFGQIPNKVLDIVDNIFDGYIYDFVINLGDRALGFFTPDNIYDFDFSSLILFALGAVILGLVIKIIQIFT